MKTAEEILEKYVEKLFRHTEVISKENAIKAMEEYKNQTEPSSSEPENTFIDLEYIKKNCPHKNVVEEVAGGRRAKCLDCGKICGG